MGDVPFMLWGMNRTDPRTFLGRSGAAVHAAAPPLRDTRGGRDIGPCISTNGHELERKCGGRNRTKGFPTHCEWRLRYAQRLLFPKSRSSLLDEVTQFLHREPHQIGRAHV